MITNYDRTKVQAGDVFMIIDVGCAGYEYEGNFLIAREILEDSVRGEIRNGRSGIYRTIFFDNLAYVGTVLENVETPLSPGEGKRIVPVALEMLSQGQPVELEIGDLSGILTWRPYSNKEIADRMLNTSHDPAGDVLYSPAVQGGKTQKMVEESTPTGTGKTVWATRETAKIATRMLEDHIKENEEARKKNDPPQAGRAAVGFPAYTPESMREEDVPAWINKLSASLRPKAVELITELEHRGWTLRFNDIAGIIVVKKGNARHKRSYGNIRMKFEALAEIYTLITQKVPIIGVPVPPEVAQAEPLSPEELQTRLDQAEWTPERTATFDHEKAITDLRQRLTEWISEIHRIKEDVIKRFDLQTENYAKLQQFVVNDRGAAKDGFDRLNTEYGVFTTFMQNQLQINDDLDRQVQELRAGTVRPRSPDQPHFFVPRTSDLSAEEIEDMLAEGKTGEEIIAIRNSIAHARETMEKINAANQANQASDAVRSGEEPQRQDDEVRSQEQ